MKKITKEDLLAVSGVQELVSEIDSRILFGEALHAALSQGLIPIHQGQRVYRINFKIGTTEQYSMDLIEWFIANHEDSQNNHTL